MFDWLRQLFVVQPKTLRIFLVRTGEYEVDRTVSINAMQWPLSKTGQRQAERAGKKIADTLCTQVPRGNAACTTVVITSNEQRLSYRQTGLWIVESLKRHNILVQTIESLPGVPEAWDIEQYLRYLGKAAALVMVIDGTNLEDCLRRYGGSLKDVTDFGPPHGSVHELVITYQPASLLRGPHIVSRRFV